MSITIADIPEELWKDEILPRLAVYQRKVLRHVSKCFRDTILLREMKYQKKLYFDCNNRQLFRLNFSRTMSEYCCISKNFELYLWSRKTGYHFNRENAVYNAVSCDNLEVLQEVMERKEAIKNKSVISGAISNISFQILGWMNIKHDLKQKSVRDSIKSVFLDTDSNKACQLEQYIEGDIKEVFTQDVENLKSFILGMMHNLGIVSVERFLDYLYPLSKAPSELAALYHTVKLARKKSVPSYPNLEELISVYIAFRFTLKDYFPILADSYLPIPKIIDLMLSERFLEEVHILVDKGLPAPINLPVSFKKAHIRYTLAVTEWLMNNYRLSVKQLVQLLKGVRSTSCILELVKKAPRHHYAGLMIYSLSEDIFVVAGIPDLLKSRLCEWPTPRVVVKLLIKGGYRNVFSWCKERNIAIPDNIGNLAVQYGTFELVKQVTERKLPITISPIYSSDIAITRHLLDLGIWTINPEEIPLDEMWDELALTLLDRGHTLENDMLIASLSLHNTKTLLKIISYCDGNIDVFEYLLDYNALTSAKLIWKASSEYKEFLEEAHKLLDSKGLSKHFFSFSKIEIFQFGMFLK